MIVRPLDSSEKDVYNAVVKHPLQSWEWGEFRKKTGVQIERFGVFDGSRLVSGMQISFHPVPYTPFTVGYFPKGTMPDEEQLHALEGIGKRKNALYIKMEPNIGVSVGSNSAHTAIIEFLKQHGAVPGRPLFTRYTFMLDLTPLEEKLLENMKQKTRYNIRLAEKKGVTIVEDSTDAGLEEYLKILKETTRRQAFYAHNEAYFRSMWQTLKQGKMIHVFKAMFEGKTLVAWIVFIHNNTLYYPYGASSSQHRELMASNLMMWEVMKFGKSAGCTKFDMWGSLGPNPNPKDPWYGFHTFKEGYGAVLTEFLGTYDLVLQSALYTLFRALEDLRWKFLRLKASLFRH